MASPIAPSSERCHRETRAPHPALLSQSPHEVLGVESGADWEAVRAAYRRLARRYHPDAAPKQPASLAAAHEAIFVRATAAYETLLRSRRAEPGRPRPSTPTPPDPHHSRTPLEASSAPCRQPTPPGTRSVPPGSKVLDVAATLRDARLCLVQGDPERAVSLLHAVLPGAVGQDLRAARRLLARASIEVPRWRRYAVSQLRTLLDEVPHDAEAHALLGVAYHREGLLFRARATLEKALRIDPEQTDARQALRLVKKECVASAAPSLPEDVRRSGQWRRLLALVT